MKNSQTIDVFPVRGESLCPAEFLKLVETNPGMIERSTIMPPKLGEKGFGAIHVQYSRPRYRPMTAFRPVAR